MTTFPRRAVQNHAFIILYQYGGTTIIKGFYPLFSSFSVNINFYTHSDRNKPLVGICL